MIARKRTRKCTRKCKHFWSLRENNKGFEEPDGHNKLTLFITANSTPCTQHVLKTVTIVLYAEAIKFFKRLCVVYEWNFDKIIILNFILSVGMLSWITNAKLLTLPKIDPRNFD